MVLFYTPGFRSPKTGQWCLIHHFTTVHKPEPFKSHISTSPPLGLSDAFKVRICHSRLEGLKSAAFTKMTALALNGLMQKTINADELGRIINKERCNI